MSTRPLLPCLCVAVAALVAAGCGGDTASRQQPGDATLPGSGGDTSGASGASGDAGANACPDTTELGPPISELPGQVGCFAGVDGRWQAIPCACDLWVDSPRTSALMVSFALSFTPTDMPPSFDGDVEVSVGFPDASGAWFDVWQRQAEQDRGFSVIHLDDDTTRVLLGQSDVTLEPVPLAACESRHARATIQAPWGTPLQLAMVATLADPSGDPVSTVDGLCEQSARHP